MRIPRTFSIHTSRLPLRASAASDAHRAYEIQSNWNVTRNLSGASWPADFEKTSAWFATHADEWEAGQAFRFAMMREDVMIGLTDIGDIQDACGELGYWLDETYWGQGLATEAASAMVALAFDSLQLRRLYAGRAFDNVASGRVLKNLGFQKIEEVERYYGPRQENIRSMQYELKWAA